MTRIVVIALAICSVAPSARAQDVVASGHISATGSWSNTRSVTVLTWTSGIDGFLFDAADVRGTCITTHTTDNGGIGYNLTFNFHDAARVWVGWCSTGATDERCIVPDRAQTGEVTGVRGVDLDIDVVIVHPPGTEGCRTTTRS